ncbi:replication termination factor 2 [Rhinolophus ferrumequinum]|uniref:Replication termination factor 2 n=1 Tax=Rhinolophus ferrumequinum TaxID=59479 RepID=A0A7J7S935_RHIFE|nr:replication termination factor 2 [Rhinolophus ferrumequinum]
MGCDGGTIPKRHELVKGPKKVEKVDKDAELVAQWNYCALSQEILRRPIVACELGRLYNKDAVIEFLLDKSSGKALGKAASHIKSIKNVTELRLSDNPAWEGDKGNTKGDKHDDLQRARFICPVVGLEMNGRHRFCFLRCCGCVFSERALKEIKAEVCHTCGAAFQDDDVIVLNGTKEDVEMLKSRMEERRLRARLEKASCQVVQSPRDPTCPSLQNTRQSFWECLLDTATRIPKYFPDTLAAGNRTSISSNSYCLCFSNNSYERRTEKLTFFLKAKKAKKPKAAESVSKLDVSEESAGPSKIKAGKPEETSLDSREKKITPASKSAAAAANGSSSGRVGKPPCGAAKRSIADSEESEAYKSLFTTHSSAKRSKEESAHWVTHTSYCF